MKKALLIIVLAVLVHSLHAEAVLKLQQMNQQYLIPDSTRVAVEIKNQIATTVAKQFYHNDTGQDLVLQYGFPLDVNASVIDFKWIINGQGYQAEIAGQSQDTTFTGGGEVDLQLKDYLGESPFVFSFNDTLKADSILATQITFIELLRYRGGQLQYSYPSHLPTFSDQTMQKLIFNVRLESERAILFLASPSHPQCNIQRNPHQASLELELTNVYQPDPFRLTYSVAQSNLGVTVMGIKPSTEDGYFVLLAEPTPATDLEEVIAKVFTFIIDVSGSMSGTKIAQAKEAACYCILHLNPKDKFNIIQFNSSATRFKPNPMPATQENILAGINYIDNLQAVGGTDLGVALLNGLAQPMTTENANIFIFLTDGWGAIDLNQVKAANSSNTRIFVFGIGTSVDQVLLRRIAADHNGNATFLGNDQVAQRIPEFFNQIKDPLILNMAVTFSAGGVSEIYPLQLPDLYAGEQLVLAGRYTTPGPAQVTLRGKALNNPVSYTYDLSFPADSSANIFIPKMWAKQKIESLLLLIAQVGEHSNPGKEYILEVIRLSKLYGILTPYTSFRDTGNTTSIIEEDLTAEADLPQAFELLQNYPNPFNPATTIQFQMHQTFFVGIAILKIYNLQGQLVRVYMVRVDGTGLYRLTWDGTDQFGAQVASGSYIYQLWIGDQVAQKTMILLH